MEEIYDQLSAADVERLQSEADSFGISVKKLIANRANSAKSTGPRTEEGRKRSSLNATRHSLSGQFVCKTQEELDFHAKMIDGMMAEWLPEGPSEIALVVSLAENTIRNHRARALEDGIFAIGFRKLVDAIDSGHPEADAAMAHSQTFLENAKSIALLSVYEQRTRRALREDREQLKQIQAERKAAYEKAREEAYQLTLHADRTGKEYKPGDDFEPAAAHGGFVYDVDAIDGWADRRDRLQAARDFNRNWKPAKRTPDSAPSGPGIDRAA